MVLIKINNSFDLNDWLKSTDTPVIDGFICVDDETALFLKLQHAGQMKEFIKLPEDSRLLEMFVGRLKLTRVNDSGNRLINMEEMAERDLIIIGESHTKIELQTALDLMMSPGFVISGSNYMLLPTDIAEGMVEKHKCLQTYNHDNLLGDNEFVVYPTISWYYRRIQAHITGW